MLCPALLCPALSCSVFIVLTSPTPAARLSHRVLLLPRSSPDATRKQYVAPEVLNQNYDMKCDLWSIGIIAYMLLTGVSPFSGTEEEIMRQIRDDNVSYPRYYWEKLSKGCKAFVQRLLTKDPQIRPSAEEALKDPWIHATDHSDHHIDHSVIGNIHNYLGYSKFKQAALFAVAFNTDQQGIDKIRTAFEELDQDGLGVITPDEFYDVMKGNGVEDDEIKEMYEKLDPGHSHQVNYTMFIAAALEKRVYLDECALHEAFHKFDINDKGYITQADLASVLGSAYTEQDIEEMISVADFKHDAHITFEEFADMMADKVATESTKKTISTMKTKSKETLIKRLSQGSRASQDARIGFESSGGDEAEEDNAAEAAATNGAAE